MLIRRLLTPVSIFFLFFGITVLFQWFAGAYSADLAGEDEAAHYVTGLMVRSYLVSGQWLEPMQFAQAYYDAYPKVALGHWPPGFYLIQALWTLPFHASRESILFLMAALAAACATLSYRLFSGHIGIMAAILSNALFLSMPVVQYISATVMAELLVLVWTLLAMLAYAKFLQSEQGFHALLFGLFAAAAILTKANGFALALIPPVAILLTRKLGWIRRVSFWLPLPIVAITCGPWYWFTFRAAKEGWQGSKSPTFLLGKVAAYNLWAVYYQIGSVLLLLAAIGFYGKIVRPIREGTTVHTGWAVATAALFANLIFHSVIAPVRDSRHLGAVILLVLMFAAAGLRHGIDILSMPSNYRVPAALACAGLAVSAYAIESFRLVKKPTYGASHVASILNATPYERSTLLVSSPAAIGEGAIIAESAMLSPQPRRRILRSSKLLADMSWDAKGYKLLAQTPADVLEAISNAGVDVLVWQKPASTDTETPHHVLIAEILRTYPDRFKKVPSASGVNTFDVYAVAKPEQ